MKNLSKTSHLIYNTEMPPAKQAGFKQTEKKPPLNPHYPSHYLAKKA
jgi:hypothetical protein